MSFSKEDVLDMVDALFSQVPISHRLDAKRRTLAMMDARGKLTVNADAFPTDEEGEANARLITAAPEMLELLESIEKISPLWVPSFSEESYRDATGKECHEAQALYHMYRRVTELIAKARGEI